MKTAVVAIDLMPTRLAAIDPTRLSASSIVVTDAAQDGEPSGRSISYIFSDETVARDGHTISSAGWQLDNFLKNPVFLFCHDQNAPPVGRVTSIARSGSRLLGTVEYADADTYPFADTIFRLTKGGFLNATSVSWLPIEWKHATDRSRPGGIDFIRQELLEISAVPVPALPSALVTARAQGIDTGPMFDWATRLLDAGGKAVIPRAELETLRKEAKMPKAARNAPTSEPTVAPPIPSPELALEEIVRPGHHEIVDGVQLVASLRGLGFVVARPVQLAARGELRTADSALRRSAMKRGLYEVADLCYALQMLEWSFENVCAEANWEDDGSPIPARFRAWLNEGNAMLAAMCAEETSENIVDTQAPEAVDDIVERGIIRALAGLGLARAGRVLSGDNERCLREAQDLMSRAHGHIKSAAKKVKSIVDKNDAPDDDPDDADPDDADPDAGDDGDDDDDNERSLRRRRAAALKQLVS